MIDLYKYIVLQKNFIPNRYWLYGQFAVAIRFLVRIILRPPQSSIQTARQSAIKAFVVYARKNTAELCT